MPRNLKIATALVLVLSAFALGAVTIINLATQVSGVLAVANGGSGKNSSVATVLTPGTTVSVDFSLTTIYTLVPAQAETINAANCATGRDGKIIITTNGASSFVLTFSTNFKSVGTLTTGTVTAKVFVISFVCNGTGATEVSRTTAM